MSDPELWIALRDVPGLGPRAAVALIRRFGSPRALFAAPEAELRELGGDPLVAALSRAAGARAPRDELRRARDLGIRILGQDDPDFPPLLREIPDPPLALQVRGGLPSGPAVAIVGSRRPSRCARDMARALGFAASRAGASVVRPCSRPASSAPPPTVNAAWPGAFSRREAPGSPSIRLAPIRARTTSRCATA
jgi:DNA processing protein